MEIIFKLYYSNLQRAVFHGKNKPLSNTLLNKLCKKKMKTRKFVSVLWVKYHLSLWGEITPSLRFGRKVFWVGGHSALSVPWQGLTASLGLYKRWTVKDLIKKKEEGSHNLEMHTCWAEMMFAISSKVQEPAVLVLSMNQQHARVLGAACSQGRCELRGTLLRAVDGEWD